jgi:hypothetical protein
LHEISQRLAIFDANKHGEMQLSSPQKIQKSKIENSYACFCIQEISETAKANVL